MVRVMRTIFVIFADMNLKSLAKDTAIYGLSSIVGRFLNYLLVPIYTYRIAAESGGYGIVTNLYAYTALFLVVLTFGMETTLFRFSNKDGENPDKVYGTVLRMVGVVALAFVGIVLLVLQPLSLAMGYSSHPEYIGCMALVVACDAFQAIMFSRLRQQHRPLKFMLLKFAFIIPNVLLNLFVFLVMPSLFGRMPVLGELYAKFDYGVGLIFFINLLCTALVFFGFGNELKGLSYGFDRALCKRMAAYTWPLLVFGLIGILNQVADKILFPYLVPGREGQVQLGIYGACVKIAMIMSLLVQAFRYAYEPIVFSGSRSKDNPQNLADGMKYFIIFALMAFLSVIFYMPVLRHLINPSYWEGLSVIPIVMLAEIFMGVYFNLSFWYKLTDDTWWGAVLSAAGALVMIAVNVIFVPVAGYRACAWGGFAGYGTAMLLSWFIGRRKYPINYDLRTVFVFIVVTAAYYYIYEELGALWQSVWLSMGLGTVLLASYFYLAWKTIKKR